MHAIICNTSPAAGVCLEISGLRLCAAPSWSACSRAGCRSRPPRRPPAPRSTSDSPAAGSPAAGSLVCCPASPHCRRKHETSMPLPTTAFMSSYHITPHALQTQAYSSRLSDIREARLKKVPNRYISSFLSESLCRVLRGSFIGPICRL